MHCWPPLTLLRRYRVDGRAVLTRLVHFCNDLQALLGINFNLRFARGIKWRRLTISLLLVSSIFLAMRTNEMDRGEEEGKDEVHCWRS